tara:strand:+ start:637 stop:1098 length:462 start_codon:yes stop_codon:yes gene_type:complete
MKIELYESSYDIHNAYQNSIHSQQDNIYDLLDTAATQLAGEQVDLVGTVEKTINVESSSPQITDFAFASPPTISSDKYYYLKLVRISGENISIVFDPFMGNNSQTGTPRPTTPKATSAPPDPATDWSNADGDTRTGWASYQYVDLYHSTHLKT